MRCEYCDVEVVRYPDTGICPCCGGKLPPRPAPAEPVQIPVQPQFRSAPVLICPKCRSAQVVAAPRGFSWGLALLGFCLLSVFGLPLGFCGSKKMRWQCTACRHKWKRN